MCIHYTCIHIYAQLPICSETRFFITQNIYMVLRQSHSKWFEKFIYCFRVNREENELFLNELVDEKRA